MQPYPFCCYLSVVCIKYVHLNDALLSMVLCIYKDVSPMHVICLRLTFPFSFTIIAYLFSAFLNELTR